MKLPQQTTNTSSSPPSSISDTGDTPPRRNASRPYIWPAIVVMLLVFPAGFLALLVSDQIAFEVYRQKILNRGYSVDFTDWAEFDFDPTVLGDISFTIPYQVLLVVVVLIAAMFGRESIKNQLGLVRPRLSCLGWFLVLYGTLGLHYLNHQLITRLISFFWPDAFAGSGSGGYFYVQAGYSPTAWFIVFAIVTAAYGFSEELLFRGYAQRRMLKRWPVIPTIALTTIVFALSHHGLYHILSVVLLGLWFGILAWRTGSIWPAVFAHALINLYVCLMIRLSRGTELMQPDARVTYMLLAILPMIAFIGALIYLILAFRKTQSQGDGFSCMDAHAGEHTPPQPAFPSDTAGSNDN